MRMVINRWHMSVKYKVIATSVDSQEKESEKATNSKKKRKYRKLRNLSANKRIERQETEYVGVCWDKRAQRWNAKIHIDKNQTNLGSFDSDYDAALRYDEEARKQGKAVNFKFSDEDVQAEKRKKS